MAKSKPKGPSTVAVEPKFCQTTSGITPFGSVDTPNYAAQTPTHPAPTTASPGTPTPQPASMTCLCAAPPPPSSPTPPTSLPHQLITITILPNRRITLTPSPTELEQLLVRAKNFRRDRAKTEHENLFVRVGDGIETDLGFHDRLITKLEELDVPWTIERLPGFPEPEPSDDLNAQLTSTEQTAFVELMDGFGGGYVLIPPNYNPERLLAALVSSYRQSRILIGVRTNKRLKSLQQSLNSQLRDLNITFNAVLGTNTVTQYALTTHELLKQIQPDEADVLIIEDADRVSGPEIQRAVRKFPILKYGITTTTGNAKEDKAMLMEGIFGPQVTLIRQ